METHEKRIHHFIYNRILSFFFLNIVLVFFKQTNECILYLNNIASMHR